MITFWCQSNIEETATVTVQTQTSNSSLSNIQSLIELNVPANVFIYIRTLGSCTVLSDLLTLCTCLLRLFSKSTVNSINLRPTMNQPQWPSFLNKSPITEANLHISCFSLVPNWADKRWAEKHWNIFHALNMGQETVSVQSDTPNQKISFGNLHTFNSISVFYFIVFLPSLFPQLLLSCPDFLYFCFVDFCIPPTPLKKKSHLRTLSGSVCHPYPWEITNNMGVRAGFIPTPALPEDKQLWKCSKSYCNGPPAAGDDSDLWAVWRRGAKVTGGPPLLLTGAAHMEDIPKMKRQGLISRAEVWDTSVIIEQRSAEEKKQIYSH